MSKIPLVLIVGPTAVGKTKLSVSMAKYFNGEIISGDSVQVYRGMDIGTAKVTLEEQEGIPHYLIDILDPDTPFSVADFQQRAKEKIDEIYSRQHVPFIVGGTGLYVQSITHNYEFTDKATDFERREELTKRAETEGSEVLYSELKKLDPEAAEKIHPNNTRRVIRALEVILSSEGSFTAGRVLSEDDHYLPIWVGLTMERKLLYERINARVDAMISQGLIDEVKALVDKGFADQYALNAIGYKEIILYLKGELSMEEAVEHLKRNTRRFAKRQLTWFNRIPGMTWFDMSDPANTNLRYEEISSYIAGKLHNYAEYGKEEREEAGGRDY